MSTQSVEFMTDFLWHVAMELEKNNVHPTARSVLHVSFPQHILKDSVMELNRVLRGEEHDHLVALSALLRPQENILCFYYNPL